jgi:hypothetical protein
VSHNLHLQRGIAVAGVNSYEDSDLYLAPPPPLPDSDADLAADLLAADGGPGANATGPPDAPAPAEPEPQARQGSFGRRGGPGATDAECVVSAGDARRSVLMLHSQGPPAHSGISGQVTDNSNTLAAACNLTAAKLHSSTARVFRCRQPHTRFGSGWRGRAGRRKQRQPTGAPSIR